MTDTPSDAATDAAATDAAAPPAPVLIVGPTSPIARALAAALAARGTPLVLAGRDREETERVARDLTIRYGVAAHSRRFEAAEPASAHAALFADCLAFGGGTLGGVIVVSGMLGPPDAARDPEAVRRLIDVNFAGPAGLLTLAANHFEARRGGYLVVFGSVAGDRGRQSNYAYGAAKGGLERFAQGLRNRLHPAGVPVLLVKPGFVDTAMTYGKPGLFLVASPARVARDVLRAIRRRRDVIYTPRVWWAIMAIIRAIPERVFKRLGL